MAVEGSLLDIGELLIKSGAFVDLVSRAGYSLLHHAILRGHIDGAKFLLAHGANAKQITGENQTPLQLAIAHSVTVFSYLLPSLPTLAVYSLQSWW